MSKKIWALRHLIYSFDIKILETVCRSKIIGLRYSACGVHLNVVDPGGDGEVNAEDDDEHQQADEEEQPVLPPKLYTCRHTTVTSSASKSSIRRFAITEKAPTGAFSWLKAATTAFTFKTLLRHYAKRALTPQSLNVKLQIGLATQKS